MTTSIALISALIAGLAAPACLAGAFHLYRLSSYRPREWAAALKRTHCACLLVPAAACSVSFVIAAVIWRFCGAYVTTIAIWVLIFVSGAVSAYITRPRKVKLRLTPRALRFAAAEVIFAAALAFPLALFYPPLAEIAPFAAGLAAAVFAHFARTPAENRRNAAFAAAAERKLGSILPTRIGITGSYGKTTAKNILAAFLGAERSVCASRGNFNTFQGIVRTVNEDLRPDHDTLIAEMGARYTGDIAEICTLVRPTVGIITAIGTQHLETFGSVEALASAKNELILALPSDGIAVFNGDDPGCRRLYRKCALRRKLISGRDEAAIAAIQAAQSSQAAPAPGSEFDCFYGGVTTGPQGTSFTLCVSGETAEITTSLLGAHVPSMIAECALAAAAMGIDIKEIKNAAKGLKPVAHRLELLYNGNDAIIDDAYNSNESGAAVALDVLAAFPPPRVLVTPGLVELGKRQNEANEDLGRLAAKKCDFALFVGPNAERLAAGAKSGGMKEERITIVRDLAAATKVLSEVGKGERRAILFENDLPDGY